MRPHLVKTCKTSTFANTQNLMKVIYGKETAAFSATLIAGRMAGTRVPGILVNR